MSELQGASAMTWTCHITPSNKDLAFSNSSSNTTDTRETHHGKVRSRESTNRAPSMKDQCVLDLGS